MVKLPDELILKYSEIVAAADSDFRTPVAADRMSDAFKFGIPINLNCFRTAFPHCASLVFDLALGREMNAQV